ncbi:MAG: hypothetical protein WKG07_46465 [Hymenobacter sp.]
MVRKIGIAGGRFCSSLRCSRWRRAAQCRSRRHRATDSAADFRRFHLWLARQCRGQVRVFWNPNAVHTLTWAIGQAVWTYRDPFAAGGVPVVTPTDPLFFASSLPIAAARTDGLSGTGRVGCSTSSCSTWC